MSDHTAAQVALLCLRLATVLGLLSAVIDLWPGGMLARARGRGLAPGWLLWGWRFTGCLYLAAWLFCPASIRAQVTTFWPWFGAVLITIPGTRIGRRAFRLH